MDSFSSNKLTKGDRRMKFCDAMDLLKSGSKITREPWKQAIYFLMDGKIVNSYQPRISPYLYDEDIMVSDGWLVEGETDEFPFCEVVIYLQEGLKAMLKDWKDMYIYLDRPTKSLVAHSMDVFPFTPDFESFIATDWIELK